MFYHDQLRVRIRTSLVLLPAIMFRASALAVPLEPEAHEFYGHQQPQYELALPTDHGEPANFDYPSSFPPFEGRERIELPVPFLEPEPRQGPLAREIRIDLIDEFTPTYQQLEASVCNNYWTETPLDPELSGSGAAYDQSSYHNRGGKGNVFVDPSGQRARTGCVNIHLPGEEVKDLAYPESVRVKKRSLIAPPEVGYDGVESFEKRVGQEGSVQVAQLDSIDPSLGSTGEHVLDGYGDLREFPRHKRSYHEPYRESFSQGFTEETPRRIKKHPWPEHRERHGRKLGTAKNPIRKVAEVTVTRTVTVSVTKRPRNTPNRTVCVPTTLTVEVTKTTTLNSVLPAHTVTTTRVFAPTELPGKLSKLDERLKELGDELKHFEPGN